MLGYRKLLEEPLLSLSFLSLNTCSCTMNPTTVNPAMHPR